MTMLRTRIIKAINKISLLFIEEKSCAESFSYENTNFSELRENTLFFFLFFISYC